MAGPIRDWAGQQLAALEYSGSHAKETGVRGHSDVDVFVSLKSNTTESLKEIYNSLFSLARQSGWSPRLQNVSVGVALPAWCITILRDHRKRQIAARMRAGAKWIDQDLVFTNRCGGPTNPAEVSYEFTKHLKDAALPHVRFHDLRHGFASMLLSDGEDLGVISDMMGHSTIAITKDLYAESSREAKRRAVARLDTILGSRGRVFPLF